MPHHPSRIGLLLPAVIATLGLRAQQPQLVKDINPAGSADIGGLICQDGRMFFRADDGSHGAELWTSDGTEAGTVMLKDINAGTGDSYPGPFVAFNGRVYFGADDGTNGEQLWMTDGTEAGTMVVPGVYTQFTAGDGFTVFNGQVYFRGTTDPLGSELWATDGTEAGTHLIKDIQPGSGGSFPSRFTAMGDRLFFAANDGEHGTELWATDGTEAGTVLVRDIEPGGNASNPGQFAVLGSQLIFEAYNFITGGELWTSDGTEEGTVLLKDLNPDGDGSPWFLTTCNGRVYFRGWAATTGTELWATDGTTAGTLPYADVFPGDFGSSPEELGAVGGTLYFSAIGDYDLGRQLWRTVAGSGEVTTVLLPGSTMAGPLNSTEALVGCGTQLFYDARYDAGIGEELYTLALPAGVAEASPTGLSPLWPNPTAGLVHVDAPANARIALHAADGRLVLERSVALPLDLGALPDGAYIARILDANGAVLGGQRVVKMAGR